MRRAALELFAAAALLSVAISERFAFRRGPAIILWTAALIVGVRPLLINLFRQNGLNKLISKDLTPTERLALGGCGVVALLALVSGLLGPVNNWDSMTYHLPRARHWLADGSTALYPTHSLRQVCFPVGSTYLIAQLRLLFATQRLDFLPQWLAFVGLMAAVSLSAQRMAGKTAGAWGALLVAGLPLCVLEATTAQNDLLAALWACLVLVFSLEDKPLQGRNLARLWAALALCAATKPTAFLFGAPMLLVALSREENRLRGVLVCAGLCAAALIPALPHFWRNHAAFGAALGIYDKPLNARLGPGVFLSNALRGLALQLPLPPVWRSIAALLRAVGLDPNDRATSFTPFVHLRLSVLLNRLLSPDEDYAAAPLQLLACAAALFSFARARKHLPAVAGVALGLLAYFSLIKWQEWGNRLVLPAFALALPLAAAWLAERMPRAWAKPLSVALAACGALAVILHVHRPLRRLAAAPRASVFLFSGYGREHADAFTSLPAALAKDGCARVGLDLGDDDWEEPWWALAPGARFKSVNVANTSKALPQEFPDQELCAVIRARGPAVVYFDRNDLAGYEIRDGRVKLPDVETKP